MHGLGNQTGHKGANNNNGCKRN